MAVCATKFLVNGVASVAKGGGGEGILGTAIILLLYFGYFCQREEEFKVYLRSSVALQIDSSG